MRPGTIRVRANPSSPNSYSLVKQALYANEFCAFPACRWPTDGLFERVNQRIKAQIEKVEDMTGNMDPKTNFALIVIQTELERYKYIVRSYLRARIAKVRTLPAIFFFLEGVEGDSVHCYLLVH